MKWISEEEKRRSESAAAERRESIEEDHRRERRIEKQRKAEEQARVKQLRIFQQMIAKLLPEGVKIMVAFPAVAVPPKLYSSRMVSTVGSTVERLGPVRLDLGGSICVDLIGLRFSYSGTSSDYRIVSGSESFQFQVLKVDKSLGVQVLAKTPSRGTMTKEDMRSVLYDAWQQLRGTGTDLPRPN